MEKEKELSRVPVACVCTHTWLVSSSKAGKNVSCPACGRSVAVPGSEQPPVEEEPEFLRAPETAAPELVVSVRESESINWVGPALIGGAIFLLVLGLVLYGIFGGSKEKPENRASPNVVAPSQSIFVDRGNHASGNEDLLSARGNAGKGTGTGTGEGGKGRGSSAEGGQTGAAAAGTGNLNAPEGEGAMLADPDSEKTDSVGAMANASSGESADMPEDGLNVPELAGPSAVRSKNVGGGGAFGARGKKGGAFGRGGMTAQSQQSVADGLVWLAKVQEKDGHWDSKKWGGGEYNLGVTGLATLAFLADGTTHLDRKTHQPVVKRALEYILSLQQPDGSFKRSTFYEQGIATIVLCELIGMTDDKALKEPAEKAVKFIISQVGPTGGYIYEGPGDDMSVTGFQIMAIKSAILAKIEIPEEYLEKIKGFLKMMTTPDGKGRYRPHSDGSPSMTAVVLFCRLFLEYGLDDPAVLAGAEQLIKMGPDVNNEYYTYYATYCMYQLGENDWVKWNNVVRDAVIARQEKKDPALRGSWPADKSIYPQGSRIYVTAMNLMTLEVYYRYLPIYK